MNKKKYGFSKKERLSKKTLIDRLFKKFDIELFIYPIKIIGLSDECSTNGSVIPILISVSKRKIPKATQRNKIKRQIREVYRTRKHVLYEKNLIFKILALGFIYVAREEVEFHKIDNSIYKALKQISIEK